MLTTLIPGRALVRTGVILLSITSCRTEPGPMPVQRPTLTATPTLPAAVDPGQRARGEYISDLSGCKVCHTPMVAGVFDKAHPFAGGLEGRMPSGGNWRAPNISSDRDTGLGNWTDTQIVTAMRRGIRPDGVRLLPVMPYPYYHQMTDADARAVVVYLRTQRPFYSKVERSDALATQPVELPEPTTNVDNAADPQAHGEYLANLMHCGACHTPRFGGQANVPFAGGVDIPISATETIKSSNITSDPDTGIGQWTEEEIIAAIRTAKTPDGKQIRGPMAFYTEGWSRLDDKDAHALATYIKSIGPAHNEIQAAR